jgi:hypothetical protein
MGRHMWGKIKGKAFENFSLRNVLTTAYKKNA